MSIKKTIEDVKEFGGFPDENLLTLFSKVSDLVDKTLIEETILMKEPKEIRETVVNRIRYARKELFIITPSDTITDSVKVFPFKEMAGRGVRIRICMPISRETVGIAKELTKFCQLRHIDTSSMRLSIVDNIWLGIGIGARDISRGFLVSSNRDLVGYVKLLMERIWKGGMETHLRIDQLEE